MVLCLVLGRRLHRQVLIIIHLKVTVQGDHGSQSWSGLQQMIYTATWVNRYHQTFH